MSAEMQGLIGACAGLGLGILDWFILSRIMEKARLEKNVSPEAARFISIATFVTGFVLLPILGYVIGRYLWN